MVTNEVGTHTLNDLLWSVGQTLSQMIKHNAAFIRDHAQTIITARIQSVTKNTTNKSHDILAICIQGYLTLSHQNANVHSGLL